MRLLALDPGETMGVCLMSGTAEVISSTQLSISKTSGSPEFSQLLTLLDRLFSRARPDVVTLEDYRVYRSKAMQHVGSRVFTSELIGAVCLHSARRGKTVVRVAAQKKGRWPVARLKRWFPNEYKNLERPHAYDAWLIGLCYLESSGWRPT